MPDNNRQPMSWRLVAPRQQRLSRSAANLLQAVARWPNGTRSARLKFVAVIALMLGVAHHSSGAERASRFLREHGDALTNEQVAELSARPSSEQPLRPVATDARRATARTDGRAESSLSGASSQMKLRAAIPPVRFESRTKIDRSIKRASYLESTEESQDSRLTPPTDGANPIGSPSQRRRAAKPLGDSLAPLATTAGSLVIVLLLFLSLVLIMRRGMGKRIDSLPKEVVEVLGRAPLVGRQHLHLLRVGNKMILVHATPMSVETVTEITEPTEVDRLAGLCFQKHSQSATANFQETLNRFGSDSASRREKSSARGVDLATLERMAKKPREAYDA